jgi:hypothetical protein
MTGCTAPSLPSLGDGGRALSTNIDLSRPVLEQSRRAITLSTPPNGEMNR